MDELKMHGFQTTFFAKRNSKTLEIPRFYSNFIKLKTPHKVYLKGPSGGTWAAELVRKDGRFCLEQGWKEFQTCHSLRDKDLLVFEYDDNACFKMKVYVERIGQDINEESLQVNNAPNPSLAYSEDTQNGAKTRSQCPVARETKEIRATDSLDEDSLCFVKTMKHYNVSRSLMALPSWFVSQHLSSYGKKTIEIVLENTRKQQLPVTLVCGSRTIFGGWSQFARDNEIKEGDTCKFVLVRELTMLVHISPQKASSQELKRQADPEKIQLPSPTDKKRRVLKHADDNEAREHKLPENAASDFPSFTILMKPYNVCRPGVINISAEFVSTHCCGYGQVETITLENEQGEKCPVSMCRQGNGGRLAGGFALFVRDNQIKENDTCTFTLVDARKMLVQISRHCETSQLEEDPTCNTDGKSRRDGVNKRKRGSEKADISMRVAATTGEIAELREENRRILELLQEMKNSGSK